MAPLFVLIGVILFRRSGITRTRDLGRVAIGLGLMLLALPQLLSLMTPYEDVPSLRLLMGAIATEPVIDVILAAAVTWAAHSSVAVVLLIMSFAAQGVVPPQAAFALVLGANLGTALNPLIEAGANGDPVTKRLPLGNLLNRAVGCALGLALLDRIGPSMVTIEPNVARAVADFHTLFNLATPLCSSRCWGRLRACCAGCCRRAPCRPTRRCRSTSISRRSRLRRSGAGRGLARGAAHGRRARSDVARRARCDRPAATASAGRCDQGGSTTCSIA